MIKLEVEEMCHECPSFEPEAAETPARAFADGKFINLFGDTVIKCKNRILCIHVREYLREVK